MNELIKGLSEASRVVMLFGCFISFCSVIVAGIRIYSDGFQAGKTALIASAFIAGAAFIINAIFSAFGLDSSVIDLSTLQK